MNSSPPTTPAVIFDLDGTLIDSLADIAAALNAALADMGFPEVEPRAVRGMIGDGARVLVARALKADGAGQLDDVLAGFRRHYARCCLDHTRLYEGLAASLDRLVEAGWRLAVLSNKPEDFTRRYVTALMARWPVEAVVGGREDRPKKPDPAGALEIAAILHARPGESYLVGDSPTDIATARAAGMIPVAVAWGYRDLDVLRAAQAEVYVHEPADLAPSLVAHRAKLVGRS